MDDARDATQVETEPAAAKPPSVRARRRRRPRVKRRANADAASVRSTKAKRHTGSVRATRSGS